MKFRTAATSWFSGGDSTFGWVYTSTGLALGVIGLGIMAAVGIRRLVRIRAVA